METRHSVLVVNSNCWPSQPTGRARRRPTSLIHQLPGCTILSAKEPWVGVGETTPAPLSGEATAPTEHCRGAELSP